MGGRVQALALLLLAACAAPTVLAQVTPPSLSAGPAGNEAAGASIFAGKGACQTCHRVHGHGSRLGPELTDIGLVRTPAQMETALGEPSPAGRPPEPL